MLQPLELNISGSVYEIYKQYKESVAEAVRKKVLKMERFDGVFQIFGAILVFIITFTEVRRILNVSNEVTFSGSYYSLALVSYTDTVCLFTLQYTVVKKKPTI